MRIELRKIDRTKILLGEIELRWICDEANINKFEIFKSKSSNIDVINEAPYAVVEHASKNEAGEYIYVDKNIPKENSIYYKIVATQDEIKFSSNTELARLKILEHLNLDDEYIKNAAYYESLQNTHYDKKIWRIAEIDLILQRNFNMNFQFLKRELRSLKQAFPKFSGKIEYPKHDEIKEKARILFQSGLNPNDMDWYFIERELILKKILALIEFEYE